MSVMRSEKFLSPMKLPTADHAVGQREPDAQEERVGHEDHEQERAWQHEDDTQACLALQHDPVVKEPSRV